jgi:hypothetical protein
MGTNAITRPTLTLIGKANTAAEVDSGYQTLVKFAAEKYAGKPNQLAKAQDKYYLAAVNRLLQLGPAPSSVSFGFVGSPETHNAALSGSVLGFGSNGAGTSGGAFVTGAGRLSANGATLTTTPKAGTALLVIGGIILVWWLFS